MRPFKPRVYAFTYEQLFDFRVTRNWSFPRIARKYGCDHSSVINACKRLGVPTQRKLIGPGENVSREAPLSQLSTDAQRYRRVG